MSYHSCTDVVRPGERWDLKRRTERTAIASILRKRSETGEEFPRFHHPETESFRRFAARRNESDEIVGTGLMPTGVGGNSSCTNSSTLFSCPLRDFSAPTSRIGSSAGRVRVSLKPNVHVPGGVASAQEGIHDAAACGSPVVHSLGFADSRQELFVPLVEPHGTEKYVSNNLHADAAKKENRHNGIATNIHCACRTTSADFKCSWDAQNPLQQGNKNARVVIKDHILTAKFGIQNSDPKAHGKTGNQIADEWPRIDKEDGEESLRSNFESEQFSPSLEAHRTNRKDVAREEKEALSSNLKRFPPPISILVKTSRPDLPSHMPRVLWKSVKRNGRFVLQEQQTRPQEFFRAIRENGRLRLQLIRPDKNYEPLYAENSIAEKGETLDKDGERDEDIIHVDAVNTDDSRYPASVPSSSRDGDEVSRSLDNLEAAKCREPSRYFGVLEATGSCRCHDSSDREENCRGKGMKERGDKTGEKLRQGTSPAQWNGSVGFDNALTLLAPTQYFLQFSFTRMRPVIG